MKYNLGQLLELVAAAPATQIDSPITARIQLLIGKPETEIESELKVILDECAHGALASDFAMMTMDILYTGYVAKRLRDKQEQ